MCPTATVHAEARVVDNGPVVCATGISAGIDASLYLVARLSSPETASETADYMHYDWIHPQPDGHHVITAGKENLPKEKT